MPINRGGLDEYIQADCVGCGELAAMEAAGLLEEVRTQQSSGDGDAGGVDAGHDHQRGRGLSGLHAERGEGQAYHEAEGPGPAAALERHRPRVQANPQEAG